MESEKKKKSPLCFFLSLLGNRAKDSYIRYQAKKRFASREIVFNGDIDSVKNILLIIPDNILEALYQVENILSIMNKYENSTIYLLTGIKSAPWFKQFHGTAKLFSYESDEDCFFSVAAKELKNELSEYIFDICFILDRQRPAILNYLLTQIDSDFRISYFDDTDFPYSNLRIKSKNNTHAVENNLSISRALSIPLHDKLHWSVSKDSLEEITHALKEQSINKGDKIGCLDIDYFKNNYGKKWTKSFVDRLKSELSEYKWYSCIENGDDEKYADWLRTLEIPCFFGLSPVKIAASIHKSEVVISGKSYIFELAFLIKRKAIGLFNHDDLIRHCRNVDTSKGIGIIDNPDDDTINEVISLIS